MGKLKKRIFPENITINIGKEIKVPPVPLAGHRSETQTFRAYIEVFKTHISKGACTSPSAMLVKKRMPISFFFSFFSISFKKKISSSHLFLLFFRWKEVRHDNTVTWLAFWSDPINEKESKYVFLAASSALKGQSDKEKYEKARTLKQYILDIRRTYTRDFENKDMQKRQIAVATYLIDRLALRAGNEKVFFFLFFKFFPHLFHFPPHFLQSFPYFFIFSDLFFIFFPIFSNFFPHPSITFSYHHPFFLSLCFWWFWGKPVLFFGC